MSLPRAALAAVILCLCASTVASAEPVLTLNEAFRRVIDSHPDLKTYRFTEQSLAAEVDSAAQAPALRWHSEIENALGSGEASGFGGAELTLSLASVIERGEKRAARESLARRRLEGVELMREARKLDLLAEVARRYLDAQAAKALSDLATDDLAQRETLVDAARKRRRAGAEPESVVLAADATRVRVEGERDRSLRASAHAMQRLVMLWDGDLAALRLAEVDLGTVPAVPDRNRLIRQLADTPELQRFAHESRLREARLQLARTTRIADIDWQIGLRRLQADGDWALLGSVSVPFGSASRAEPGLRAAEAELAALEFERESQQRALASTLDEAWSRLDLAVTHAQQIDAQLLPALHAAAEAAGRSYRAGAASHLEWAQLQGELVEARRQRLDAALAAHRALIELQRLTGQSFTVDSAPSEGISP
ncbi:TolC family protein [Pseudomarimonas arenosa]|uniref:TolC family protein n=1 Tax=Pseudomarimonas arenosa TaxID=2774145 RepID=A0AAW3ZIU7_9GAMM|nr:TolC family protein [Pseudomarimonas arenosa]MBD8524639.1 TolC family protein [Pseudomarimonas arenosa]